MDNLPVKRIDIKDLMNYVYIESHAVGCPWRERWLVAAIAPRYCEWWEIELGAETSSAHLIRPNPPFAP
jgi:hypothetical protein